MSKNTAFNPHARITKSTASFSKQMKQSDLDAWHTQADSESDINRVDEPDSSRDQLLTRCRDAIESLHEELQDERKLKHQL